MTVHVRLAATAVFALSIAAGASSLSTATTAAEDCSSLTGCEWKMCEVRNEIAFAEKHSPKGTRHLNVELGNLRASCTDVRLRGQILGEMSDMQDKIRHLEREKREEEDKGKPRDARKISAEIAARQVRMRALEADLKHFE